MRPLNARRFGCLVAPTAAAIAVALAATTAAAAPEDDDDLVLDDDLDDDLDEEPEAAPASEAVDDEEAPSGRASGSVSLGGGADGDAEGKGRKRKKRVRPKRDRCHSKPFDILDCVPGNHTLEVGMHAGLFILGGNHGLFDAGVAPQPDIRQTNANIGWRILYLPIPYVGIGFESSIMPTRSPSEEARATMYTLRGHIAGQAPWRITPTFVMGGGFMGISSDNELLNSGDAFFYYGPGGKFYINDWIAVRVEGRHLVSPDGNNSKRVHNGEIFAALDITLPIGKWVERSRRKKNKDRDGDGYPDADDRCPNDYGEGDLGCPDDLDSDKDGVPDSRDRCPNQWGDSAGGCPVPDEDGDGILDSSDSCVDEAEVYNGYQDEDGCPDDEPAEVKAISGVIEGIYFDSGKTKIKSKSKPVLDQAAETLAKFPDVRLRITGYTDNVGNSDKNMSLSAARAESVKTYLVGKGVDASRLETAGAGSDKPIADNSTKDGRAKNRRIEFERIDQVQQ